MSDRLRLIFTLVAGLAAVVALFAVTAMTPPSLESLADILVFGALIAFAMAYSIPIGGGHVSLMPMSLAAAYFVHGRTIAGWAVCLGMIGHAGIRWWRAHHLVDSHEPRGRLLFEATTVNVAMHTLGVLAAGTVYQSLGGKIPLTTIDLRSVGLLVIFALAYLVVNHVLVSSYLVLRQLGRYYLKSVPTVLLYEAGPLVFTPLIVLIYTRLGSGYFFLFALALCISSLISHHLALTSQRLQRRLQELSSLQVVGQALSSSLDIEMIVSTIYEQVTKLMAAPSFYVALYDRELNEVSFPVAVENNVRADWRSRSARRGLTEYVLETRQPLLISSDVADRVAELGLEHIGNPAACWLGIPIIAGDEALGMIALQSLDTPGAYDASHLEIMQMIADQAAIAIQNARLYERTDEALARRVQELDSVLRTSAEGVLLLDLEWRVLAGNRALAEFLEIAQVDLPRHPIDAVRPDGQRLLSLIHYTADSLSADCARLVAGKAELIQTPITLGTNQLPVERTLTPVRDARGAITGWLLVFRDMTEEIELEQRLLQLQARNEELDAFAHTVAHDLKGPLSSLVLYSSFLKEQHELMTKDQVTNHLEAMARSGLRMSNIVNELLLLSSVRKTEEVEVSPLNMKTIVGNVQERLFRQVDNSKADIILPTSWPIVMGRPQWIEEIWTNYISNAMKYGGSPPVIELGWNPVKHHDASNSAGQGNAPSESTIRFWVRDNGSGLTQAEQAVLFAPFERLHQTRAEGHGLGLSIVRRIAEKLGGEVGVESEVGRGSTFWFTLPLAADDPQAPTRSSYHEDQTSP